MGSLLPRVVGLCEFHLNDAGPVFEVGERPHDLLTHRLHRLFPRGRKSPNQLSDPGCNSATMWNRGKKQLNPPVTKVFFTDD